MMNCREVSRMIADGSAEGAGFLARMQIRFHHLMCGHCRSFASQLRAVGTAARAHMDKQESSSTGQGGIEDRVIKKILEQDDSPETTTKGGNS